MKDQPAIYRDNQTLFSNYHKLKRNDIICTRIRMHGAEEAILTDLVDRGVRLIPSATAQLASRSKVFQARILGEFMLPGTLPVYNNHQLLEASSMYTKLGYSKVVLKSDKKNAGMGIHLFDSIEDLYNHTINGSLDFPFVIAPYQSGFRDLRVIIIDTYVEAYERTNSFNFRKNLHCGGDSTPCQLTEEQLAFCKRVMQRAQLPYGHIDLMITKDNHCFLTEINLRGGLRGAQISGEFYREKVEELQEKLLEQQLNPV